MDKETKGTLILIGTVLAIFLICTAAVFAYSGMNRPLTVVESRSMQHSSDTSYIGVIDTGDMVIMKNLDNTPITTFVEGQQTGYSKFGAYGDVIIYYREGKNPVIHRAILWLDYNESTDTWSAPSLKDSTIWHDSGSSDWNNLQGVITLKGLPNENGTTSDFIFSLSSLDSHKHSGYLTKGDNNSSFDVNMGLSDGLVEKSKIKAVAGMEIPWFGCLKLLLNNKNVSMIPKNSVPCLAVFFIDLIAFFAVAAIVSDHIRYLMFLKRNGE